MTSAVKTKANGTNWDAARAYFLALPASKRTYAAVARRFDVSRERVGQVAKDAGWAKTAETIDARVERKAITQVVRNRAERLARTLDVFDRASDLALELLPVKADGSVDTKAIAQMPRVDQILEKIPGLFKMAELAAGEATDRVSIADVQPVLVAFARIAVFNAPAERRGDVMRELEGASSGLVALEA